MRPTRLRGCGFGSLYGIGYVFESLRLYQNFLLARVEYRELRFAVDKKLAVD
jgi:hypothetical protein